MKFCAKCKGMMLPSGSGTLKCRGCGKVEKGDSDLKLSTSQESKGIAVIEKDEGSLPTMEKECEKCGNGTCFFWVIQTRASDEPPTRFFRCTKCKKTWREYS